MLVVLWLLVACFVVGVALTSAVVVEREKGTEAKFFCVSLVCIDVHVRIDLGGRLAKGNLPD